MYQSILVPLDGSHTAALALDHAVAIAEKFRATVHLVRVVHTLAELADVTAPSLATSAATSQDVVSREEASREFEEARHDLQARCDELQARGVVTDNRVRAGEPAAQIMVAARDSGAGLIILTAYGAGGAHTRNPGAVYGGVADEVLRQSRVPVMLIRP
ncbi:MAG TPA: universal stress protein [Dehalococcoidia bacterium]|jgi:nucleotide-binding universal stress UspA family protein|nr:universal stress protein [Dehalococcoidia bacterium]